MTKWTELTDTPDSLEGEAGKIPVVTDDEAGLELKDISDLAGTVDLGGDRYDIDDLADDDVRAIEDDKTRESIYRLTEKVKLVLQDHNDVLFGSDLSFGIVGPKGETGSSGAAGTPGSQGGSGAQGDPGPQGPQGIQGDTGPQGIQGDQGDQGDQGIQGIQGDQGDQGIQGIQGDQGDQGDQGIQGIQGIQGVQGDIGPQGDQGDQGIQGDQGVQGLQGFTGPKGDPGDATVVRFGFSNASVVEAQHNLGGTPFVQVSVFSIAADNVKLANTAMANTFKPGVGSVPSDPVKLADALMSVVHDTLDKSTVTMTGGPYTGDIIVAG